MSGNIAQHSATEPHPFNWFPCRYSGWGSRCGVVHVLGGDPLGTVRGYVKLRLTTRALSLVGSTLSYAAHMPNQTCPSNVLCSLCWRDLVHIDGMKLLKRLFISCA